MTFHPKAKRLLWKAGVNPNQGQGKTVARKNLYNVGGQGTWENKGGLSPIWNARTLSTPPSEWKVSDELRAEVFGALREWLTDYDRQDDNGTVTKHYFIRCSRCKQKETRLHFPQTPAGLIGPYCDVCLNIILTKSLAADNGSAHDITLYFVSATDKAISSYVDALLAIKTKKELLAPAAAVDDSKVF